MDPQTQEQLAANMQVPRQQIQDDLRRSETDKRVADLERQREAARAEAAQKEAMNAAARR